MPPQSPIGYPRPGIDRPLRPGEIPPPNGPSPLPSPSMPPNPPIGGQGYVPPPQPSSLGALSRQVAEQKGAAPTAALQQFRPGPWDPDQMQTTPEAQLIPLMLKGLNSAYPR